jgi:hypothetical protein
MTLIIAMNKSNICYRPPNPIISLVCCALVMPIALGGFTSCQLFHTPTRQETLAALTAQDVVGLSEAELRSKYPETAELAGSFSILVSKSLRPYDPPKTNKLLRIGREYLVVEMKDGKVIALHRVCG